MKTITGQELKERMENDRNLVVLEALPEKYYHSGHIPGALLLTPHHVDALADRLIPYKDSPVVVYCASAECDNSQVAAKRLQKLGYEDVTVFSGGKKDWQERGFDLTRSKEEAKKCCCSA
ncbi:MAG: rhodanese-like domain-containing protein [Verrucomicrobiota bacterium]